MHSIYAVLLFVLAMIITSVTCGERSKMLTICANICTLQIQCARNFLTISVAV